MSKRVTSFIQQQRVAKKNLHRPKGSMHRGATNLDSDDGIQQPDCRLKRDQQGIVIRENSEIAHFCANADACCNLFLRGPKPRFSLCLISKT